MMDKKVRTSITMVVTNEVSESEAESLKEAHDVDSMKEVARGMEEDVELLLAGRMFGDADEIPILDVRTDVTEE